MDDHLTLRLPRALARAIDRWARNRGLPRSQVVREALARYPDHSPAPAPAVVTAAVLAREWASIPRLTSDEAAELSATWPRRDVSCRACGPHHGSSARFVGDHRVRTGDADPGGPVGIGRRVRAGARAQACADLPIQHPSGTGAIGRPYPTHSSKTPTRAAPPHPWCRAATPPG